MLQSYAGSAYAAQLRSSIARLSKRLPEQTWLYLQQIADERIIFLAGAEINLKPEIWSQLDVPTASSELVELVRAELEATISLYGFAKKGEML